MCSSQRSANDGILAAAEEKDRFIVLISALCGCIERADLSAAEDTTRAVAIVDEKDTLYSSLSSR